MKEGTNGWCWREGRIIQTSIIHLLAVMTRNTYNCIVACAQNFEMFWTHNHDRSRVALISDALVRDEESRMRLARVGIMKRRPDNCVGTVPIPPIPSSMQLSTSQVNRKAVAMNLQSAETWFRRVVYEAIPSHVLDSQPNVIQYKVGSKHSATQELC